VGKIGDKTRVKKHQSNGDSGNIGTVMTALAWAAFMVLLGFFFNDLLEKQRNPNQSLSTQYPQDRIREVTLQRNKFGHYVTSGKLNGHSVVFMLDTGATGVAIPDHIARRLEIKRGRPVQVQTANGTGTAYATRLERVSVGEIELQRVEAGIVPGLTGDEVLLGMSFLRHIEFTQRGNTLVLKQHF
jgi:aspartyl protease family protein